MKFSHGRSRISGQNPWDHFQGKQSGLGTCAQYFGQPFPKPGRNVFSVFTQFCVSRNLWSNSTSGSCYNEVNLPCQGSVHRNDPAQLWARAVPDGARWAEAQSALHGQRRGSAQLLLRNRLGRIGAQLKAVVTRADRKSQVRQHLRFCTADYWALLAYESAKQKPKHCLTWDFLSALAVTYLIPP